MAKVWFSVIVLILIQDVFANDICKKPSLIRSCDECIRCGGSWCSNPTVTGNRCATTIMDTFCKGESEGLASIKHYTSGGTAIKPAYSEMTAEVGVKKGLEFTYQSSTDKQAEANILNSTQTKNSIEFEIDSNECDKFGNCKVNFEVKVGSDFCTATGTEEEFLYANVKVANVSEKALVKLHVPCSCACSKDIVRKSKKCFGHGDFACGACNCYADWTGEFCKYKMDCHKHVERKSPQCNRHGDFSCGTCNCHKGWDGDDCTIPVHIACKENRGDQGCNGDGPRSNLECSDNGYCGPCDICYCYEDMEGSRYFDSDRFCADICMDTSDYDICMTNGTIGICEEPNANSHKQITILQLDKNVTMLLDNNDKRIWAPCKSTFTTQNNEKCDVEYLASQDESSKIMVMIISSCNDADAAFIAGYGPTKVPIILGVLAIIAVVAAVAGVMMWKHFAADPFASTDVYNRIEADNAVGENPLYKPPTSTFTNPQFGKCS